MTKKTCGNCRHFAKEPNAAGRGCCFLSDDLESYPVKGEHYAPCRGWKPQTNWQRYFGTPEKAKDTVFKIIKAVDCGKFEHCGRCPVEQFCQSDEPMLEWLESEAE